MTSLDANSELELNSKLVFSNTNMRIESVSKKVKCRSRFELPCAIGNFLSSCLVYTLVRLAVRAHSAKKIGSIRTANVYDVRTLRFSVNQTQ